MRFTVIESNRPEPKGLSSQAFLLRQDWEDAGYSTLFRLVICDAEGARHDLGEVKIGEFGMPSRSTVQIPESFDFLEESFFSLGQDDSYYERLRRLGGEIHEVVLASLRDMASDPDIYQRAQHERVTRESLMRFVKSAAIENQFRRIARGGDRVAGFTVSYEPPTPTGDGGSTRLVFTVSPRSRPPTNIHVLVGRNGVGKSFLLNGITRCIGGDGRLDQEDVGRIIGSGENGSDVFSNLVSVTFSAFDELPLLQATGVGIDRYSYVGLKTSTEGGRYPRIKSPEQLKRDFANSVEACLTGERAERWTRALRALQYAGSGFIDESWPEEFQATRSPGNRRRKARSLFATLSSGHKAVLLTITKLVEHVTERTLVVIDEPESHLHPPLLAAFIRALSDLLTDRNGLAVVATHSPVVLQEIPASCIWKLRRYGSQLIAERPTIETFGENVGILTHEVFGLEVTDSGFHREILVLANQGFSYDEILSQFDGQLGGEARALARSLVTLRDFNSTQGGSEDTV